MFTTHSEEEECSACLCCDGASVLTRRPLRMVEIYLTLTPTSKIIFYRWMDRWREDYDIVSHISFKMYFQSKSYFP